MGSFRTILPKTKLNHFLGPNFITILSWHQISGFQLILLSSKFVWWNSNFFLIFGQFSYTLPKTKLTHYFCQIFVIILYLVSGWYYSFRNKFRNKFRKLTLFHIFRAVFLHFSQSQSHPFFLTKFCYYFIMGLNKWFVVDITL